MPVLSALSTWRVWLAACIATLSLQAAVPTVVTCSLPAGAVDEPYLWQLRSGSGPVTWSLTGTLPGGLALDAASGTISGVPSASGTVEFAVGASNGDGAGPARALRLTVTAPAAIVPLGVYPTRVPPAIRSAFAVAVGGTHYLAIQPGGAVAAWGDDSKGQATVPADLQPSIAVAAGSEHSLALLRDGTVQAWGFDYRGQAAVPAGLSRVTAIAAGGNASLALRDDGTVVAWGEDFYGQTALPAGLQDVVAIACGSYHCLAIRRDGSVVAWGFDGDGQCTIPASADDATQIAAGDSHSLSLRRDGTVVGWGRNYSGEASPPTDRGTMTRIAATRNQSSGLCSDGSIAFWGDQSWDDNIPAGIASVSDISGGYQGTIALGFLPPAITGPALIEAQVGEPIDVQVGMSTLAHLSCASPLPAGLVLDGATGVISGTPTTAGTSALTLTASNPAGSSGAPLSIVVQTTLMRTLAVRPGIVGQPYACSLAHGGPYPVTWSITGGALPPGLSLDAASGAITGTPSQGGVWTPEFRAASMVGTGSPRTLRFTIDQSAPLVAWPMLYGGDVPVGRRDLVSVSSDLDGSLGLGSDARPVGWGPATNEMLQLPNAEFAQLSAGHWYAAGVSTDGQVVMWGNPTAGPLEVPSAIHDAVAVALGSEHAVALDSDGSVHAWGWNGDGQTDVPAWLRATAIAAGPWHSLAVTPEGTVVAWGARDPQHDFGQADVPVGLTGVVAVAAGYQHSVALRGDGTVVAWGDHAYGQADVPVGLSDAVAIAVRGDRSMALRADGSVVVWGRSIDAGWEVPAGLVATSIAVSMERFYALGYLPPTITSPPTAATLIGQPFSHAVTSDHPVVSFAATGLPVGLAIDAATGVISGTPSVAGTFAVELSATNPAGSSTATLQLEVAAAVVMTRSLRPGILGRAYHAALVGPGGQDGRWELASGALPAGLALDATGIISGTPTGGGASVFGVRIVAAGGPSAVRRLRLLIREPAPVQAWGDNSSGQIDRLAAHDMAVQAFGFGGWPLLLLPDGTVNQSRGTDVCSLYTGAAGTFALHDDGTVGTILGTAPPTGLADVTSLAVGFDHVLAVLSDGRVRAWGLADHGPSDHGQATVPDGLNDAVAAAAGLGFSIVVRDDGTVVSWGVNDVGQTSLPAGLERVVDVQASHYHCVALRDDGTLAGWGANEAGQADIPAGIGSVLAVSCDSQYNLAILVDGSVVGWGADWAGQATPPIGLAGATSVAGDYTTSYATAFMPPAVLARDPLIATLGVPFSFTLQTANHPLAYAAGGLPDGVALETGTGLVSGVPLELGTFDVDFTVENPAGTASGRRRIVVMPAQVTTRVLRPGIVGIPYRQQLLVESSTAVTWSLTSGTLPLGLALDAATGEIRGTPGSAGTFTMEIAAAGASGSSEARLLELRIQAGAALVAWGRDPLPSHGRLSGVAVSASISHVLFLRSDGAVQDTISWSYPWGPQANVPLLSGVVAVTASPNSSFAVHGDGSVTAWGSPSMSVAMSIPTGLTQVVAVAATESRGLALREDGSLATWHSSMVGDLAIPAEMPPIVAIAAGRGHFLVLDAEGGAHGWGDDVYGQASVPAGLGAVARIAAGDDCSIAVLRDGSLAVWGYDTYGVVTGAPILTDAVAAAVDADHATVLRADGTIVAWGDDSSGESSPPAGLVAVTDCASGGAYSVAIGYLPPVIDGHMPVVTVSGSPVSVQVTATYAPTSFVASGLPAGLAIDPASGLIGGAPTALGTYDATITVTNPAGSDSATLRITVVPAALRTYSLRPGRYGRPYAMTLVAESPSAVTWEIASGSLPTGLALDPATGRIHGAPFAWGRYRFAVLARNGLGTSEPMRLTLDIHALAVGTGWGSDDYAVVSSLPDIGEIGDLSLGGNHAVAVRDDGTVVAWGWNQNGQASPPASAVGVVAVAAGARHGLALREDGTVVAWGENSYGQCDVPAGLANVTAIAAGAWHSMALLADGRMVAWGSDSSGQVTHRPAADDVVAIGAGAEHGLALRYDGTVVGWGYDYYGQSSPPPEATGVIAIASGSYHGLALTASGAVVDWGSIMTGGSPPSGASGVLCISSGTGHSLALQEDGQIAAWGYDHLGQSTPPVGLSHVTSVAAGGYSSAALHLEAPRFTSPATATVVAGQPFAFHVHATCGSAITAGDLPAWLTLDPVTGSLTGLPPTAGVIALALTAVNPLGSISSTLTITVQPAPVPVPEDDTQKSGSGCGLGGGAALVLLAMALRLRLRMRVN